MINCILLFVFQILFYFSLSVFRISTHNLVSLQKFRTPLFPRIFLYVALRVLRCVVSLKLTIAHQVLLLISSRSFFPVATKSSLVSSNLWYLSVFALVVRNGFAILFQGKVLWFSCYAPDICFFTCCDLMLLRKDGCVHYL